MIFPIKILRRFTAPVLYLPASKKAVFIKPGEEIITMSLMKRDTAIYYTGEEGIIHSVYFKPGESINQGDPLIGVCAKEKLPLIQKIITHVKAEWS